MPFLLLARKPLSALFILPLPDLLDDPGDGDGAVGPDPYRERVLPELERVDVDMDGLLAWRYTGMAGEACAAGDQEIRLHDEHQGVGRPEVSVNPSDPLVVVGEDALSTEGCDDRRLKLCREVQDRVGCMQGPEPRKDDRMLGAIDRLHRCPDSLIGRCDADRRNAGLALAVFRIEG